MPAPPATDSLVIGGGVIGLSVAYELAKSGRSVRLLEKGRIGGEASWAGAGMLPPGSWYSDHPALERLAQLSGPMHAELSAELLETTGIDDEYEVSGALYSIADGYRHNLQEKLDRWRSLGIAAHGITHHEAGGMAPELNCGDAWFVPGEAQVRNPRRLRGLMRACQRFGVDVLSETPVGGFQQEGDRILAAKTVRGNFSADQVVLASGAWTGGLAAGLGFDAPIKPMRGQMLLLRGARRTLHRMFHHGGRYLVPRKDGRVLVGSTVEDAGFDKTTRRDDIEQLRQFAIESAPCLADAEVEASWAGLRPAPVDDLPLVGRLPGCENAWIAAGHFRAGLQLAPATALLLRQMLAGEPTEMDATPLDPCRFVVSPC